MSEASSETFPRCRGAIPSPRTWRRTWLLTPARQTTPCRGCCPSRATWCRATWATSRQPSRCRRVWAVCALAAAQGPVPRRPHGYSLRTLCGRGMVPPSPPVEGEIRTPHPAPGPTASCGRSFLCQPSFVSRTNSGLAAASQSPCPIHGLSLCSTLCDTPWRLSTVRGRCSDRLGAPPTQPNSLAPHPDLSRSPSLPCRRLDLM